MVKVDVHLVSESGLSTKAVMTLIALCSVLVLAVIRMESIPLPSAFVLSDPESRAVHAEENTGSKDSVYSYRDSDGKQHFVDDEEKIPRQFREAARKRDDLPVIGKVPAAPDRPLSNRFVQRARVRILVASWCGYCNKLEQFLRQSGVRFEKLDVENSSRGRELYEQHGAGGIPVTLVDDEVIRGFRPEAIMNAIKARSPSLDAT